MKNLVIYSITNTVNGKKYVGQTRQGLARRKAEHRHRFNLGERDHKLYLAMRKHGVENFMYEVLCLCESHEELDEKERFYIARFNSFNRGYNMTCGGDSISEETRQKISAKHKGRKVFWYDKVQETRRKNRELGLELSQKKGAASKHAKRFRVRTPSGEEIEVVGLNRFCIENGLVTASLRHTLDGYHGAKTHKGYSLLERFNDQPEAA